MGRFMNGKFLYIHSLRSDGGVSVSSCKAVAQFSVVRSDMLFRVHADGDGGG